MNDEPDVRRMLEAAVRHEPPLRLDRDAVFDEGRRRLRVRRTATVGGAAVAVVAVVIGMTALSGAGLGMPDPVGPAAPMIGVTSDRQPPPSPPSPPSTETTSPPVSVPQPPVTVTTTTEPASADFGAVLLKAPVAWPARVQKEGNGTDWYVFEDRQADFHLVTADGTRRMVQVLIAPDGTTLQPLCPCKTHTERDGTKVYVYDAPIEEPGSVMRTVIAHRPSGVHVQVIDTTGFGPPWRAQPVLDESVMVDLAVLPGFDVKR